MFKLKAGELGPFDAIWESNAIVSVNVEDRVPYAELLKSFLKPSGRILMATWNYEQKLRMDRPFSTPPELIQGLFPSFNMEVVEKVDMTQSWFNKLFNFPWVLRPVMLMTLK